MEKYRQEQQRRVAKIRQREEEERQLQEQREKELAEERQALSLARQQW
jgi:hypothetical protein